MTCRSGTTATGAALLAVLLAAGAAAALAAPDDAKAPVFGAPAPPSDLPWLSRPLDAKAVPGQAAKPRDGSFLPDRPAAHAPPTVAAGRPAEPNLDALRYFAGQNDLARVGAEIRLLRARYPGWSPPTDLFTATPSDESEQPLWDLFGKHDLQGLQTAIGERRQRTPGWQPSTDLSNKLALALAGDDLKHASDTKDYGAVLTVAQAHRDLLTCANVDAVWRTAEALDASGDHNHAADAYKYVLTNCTDPHERLATVEKAAERLPPDLLDPLLRLGKHLPNGTDEFAEVRFDGQRKRLGQAIATGAAASPADLDALGARARQPGGGKDAELLGWYLKSRKDLAGAESWFRTALQVDPSPKAAEGLVLVLQDSGKQADAIAAAQQYAALAPSNRKLMAEILAANLDKTALSPEQSAALTAAIDDEQEANAAQAYGWYRFRTGAVAEAADWFRKSLGWQPNEGAVVGGIVCAQRLKQPAVATALAAQYAATYPHAKQLELAMRPTMRPHAAVRVAAARPPAARQGKPDGNGGWDQDASDIVSTFQNGDVDRTLSMLDARKARRSEPNGLAVVRGWALYKKGDWEGARQVFDEVGRNGNNEEAGKGLRQIELGYTAPRFR